jgi:alpha-galactosidase
VRADLGSAYLYGTVAADKSEALFTYMQLGTFDGFASPLAQLHGLNPDKTYSVKVEENLSANDFNHRANPGWWPEIKIRGDQLAKIGLEMPGLRPEQGLLLHLKSF